MTNQETNVFGNESGQLKIFIGAAPGVGKTYTMLREASTLRERGKDVVIGYVDAQDRRETEAQINGLEVIPRRVIHFRQRVFEEVDISAIVARRPDVVVIDELAHSNAPGSLFPKRHMDVEYLLDQGISVLTAVNIQHIESIHGEAEEITGITVRELIPESLLKRANEVAVVDVTPETLRQRLRDGNIYPLQKVDHALQHFFRKSNLMGLRELALRVVADDVDERLEKSYSRKKIPGPVGAREVIMVCVSHYDRAVKLIARGHRMALRLKAELLVLAISRTTEDLLSEKDKSNLARMKELSIKHHADWVAKPRNDRKLGTIIAEVALQKNVTQIVLGQPVNTGKWMVWKDNPVRYLLRRLRYTDIRVVGWKDAPEHVVQISDSMSRVFESSANHALSGRLTIYVGSAPGVGKTYKMLQDAQDWKRRGWDVVIGLIESHGRSETEAQIGDLEVIPKATIRHGNHVYEEMDTESIIRRKPFIVLIDELAHSNVPGSSREKRFHDILHILQHGIHVVTAVNVQHLESLHDKVEHITGIKVRERIPDWFVRLAREIRLIDVTPETLQQRLVEGRIYAFDKVERALDNFFQTANLAALRELALLEVADDVDQRNTRINPGVLGQDVGLERILVCVNHRPHSERLIRRGWRLADRLKADLWVLVVASGVGMSEQDASDLVKLEALSAEFNARFIIKQAPHQEVGATIVQTSRELHVSQLVAGQPLIERGVLSRFKDNPLDYVLEHAEFVDLHIVASGRD